MVEGEYRMSRKNGKADEAANKKREHTPFEVMGLYRKEEGIMEYYGILYGSYRKFPDGRRRGYIRIPSQAELEVFEGSEELDAWELVSVQVPVDTARALPLMRAVIDDLSSRVARLESEKN